MSAWQRILRLRFFCTRLRFFCTRCCYESLVNPFMGHMRKKGGEFPRSSKKVAGDVFQAVSLTHDPAYAAKEGTKGYYY